MLANKLIYAHKIALIRGFNALYNNYNTYTIEYCDINKKLNI